MNAGAQLTFFFFFLNPLWDTRLWDNAAQIQGRSSLCQTFPGLCVSMVVLNAAKVTRKYIHAISQLQPSSLFFPTSAPYVNSTSSWHRADALSTTAHHTRFTLALWRQAPFSSLVLPCCPHLAHYSSASCRLVGRSHMKSLKLMLLYLSNSLWPTGSWACVVFLRTLIIPPLGSIS